MKNKTPKPVFKENMSMAKIQGVVDSIHEKTDEIQHQINKIALDFVLNYDKEDHQNCLPEIREEVEELMKKREFFLGVARDIGVIIDNGIEKAPDTDHVES